MNHSHVLYDSDPHFKIDPISRKIINESSTKTTLVQHDHNSERFTFEMKRIVEGHDISLCNLVEIHYLNVESNTKTVTQGVYTVDDLHVSEDDDQTVVCSWLVGNNATQLVGQLQFIVRFACVNESTGTIEYVWNSGVFSGISIQSGIYNLDTSSDNFQLPFNFVTTIDGKLLKFFYGTKAEYNELSYEERQGLFALITDDTTGADIERRFLELETRLNNLEWLTEAPTTKYTLTEGGYYYIEARRTQGNGVYEVFPFGLIYWKPNTLLKTACAYQMSQSDYPLNLLIESNGVISLSSVGYSDLTNLYEIYITKLGGGS